MIYENFKKKLLAELGVKKATLVAEESFTRPEPLFGVVDSDIETYQKLLGALERVACRNVEELVVDLCGKHHIPAVKCEAKGGMPLFDLCLQADGTDCFIEFKTSPRVFDSQSMERFVRQVAAGGKPVYIVFLLKDSMAASDKMDAFAERMYRAVQKTGTAINWKVMLFADFIERCFGEPERECFDAAMENYQREMQEAIGYQVTELCSPENKQKLLDDLMIELRTLDYRAVKAARYAEGVAAGNNPLNLQMAAFNQILNGYISNQLYKVFAGSGDFATSFLASEWLFQKYFALDQLDNTFIVAGYLKSVEQMLWKLIQTVGQGKLIRNVTVSPQNYGTIDKTLGAMEHFLKDPHNANLFKSVFGNSQHYVIRYIKEQLAEWRTYYRNGYFHKDQLKDSEKIKAIRTQTVYLYMLILGSINMTPQQMQQLKA